MDSLFPQSPSDTFSAFVSEDDGDVLGSLSPADKTAPAGPARTDSGYDDKVFPVEASTAPMHVGVVDPPGTVLGKRSRDQRKVDDLAAAPSVSPRPRIRKRGSASIEIHSPNDAPEADDSLSEHENPASDEEQEVASSSDDTSDRVENDGGSTGDPGSDQDGGKDEEDGSGGEEEEDRRKGRAGVRCFVCKTSHTPAWRRTVDGKNYLCNACGTWCLICPWGDLFLIICALTRPEGAKACSSKGTK